jgi:hypothetical protein
MAYIEDRAFVDAEGDLSLDAQSDINVTTITPALSIGGQYGVGIGAAITHLMDTTQAFIGDFKGTVPIPGFGDGTLTGTVDVGGEDEQDPNATDNGEMEGGTTTGSNGEKFGLGFSGSVAFNWIDQNTQAFIRDKVNVDVEGDLTLEAYSSLRE